MNRFTVIHRFAQSLAAFIFLMPLAAYSQQITTNELSSGACMVVCNDVNYCRTYEYDRQNATCTIVFDSEHEEFIQLRKSCPQTLSSELVISYDNDREVWRITCPTEAVDKVE
jgi:hypothetical protein